MGIKNLDISEIIRLYNSGKSTIYISKILGVSRGVVSRILKKQSIKMRPCGRQRIYDYDENFFEKIDSEEKAYWLGFIYADGSIQTRVKSLTIGLKYSDANHLEKFLNSIKHNGKVLKRVDKNGYESAIISISNKKLVSDLEKQGVTKNKSFTLTFPELNNYLIKHFIRGFFDGDGSVWIIEDKYKKRIIKRLAFFVMGTKNIIENILKEFSKKIKLNKNKIRIEKRTSNPIYHFQYSGTFAAMIMDYLYSDCKIYLDRKYNLFQKYKIDKKLERKKFVGVFKDGNRYKASISVEGETRHIGCFSNPIDAAKAYDSIAYEVYDKNKYKLNFPELIQDDF